MSSSDPLSSDLIPAPLREALRFSPDNAPLLIHVADTVLKLGGFTEAETLFKRALALAPDQLAAKLGLAAAFYPLGKRSAALVIVEAITPADTAPAAALVLHARLALQAGETRFAARLYQRARTANPPLTDPALEEELAPLLPSPAAPAKPAPAPSFKEPSPAPEDSWRGESDSSAGPDRDDDDSRERLPVGDLPSDPNVEIERPSVGFDDVGGMDSVKEEIRMKIILPLKQPEFFYGPPGCGKTFLARATAGEVKAGFISVGINDVLDMWIGQSEKNLHALFEQARSHTPCVLFFDEVDALGANRTDMLKSGGRQMINQFLSELDGVDTTNEGVLILAATNAPWHLDSAFRRPGRFDRILFVPPPDLPARASILRLLLKGKPVDGLDFEAVAKKTEGYSGADLKALVDLAVESLLRDAMKTGKIRPVGTRELLDATKQHRATTRDWFESARNYALYANQSGLYDDVLDYLKLKK